MAFVSEIGTTTTESTSFVGRQWELEEGRRLLGGSRLVTLVGPGGVGKTRLSTRIASGIARTFRHGVWLVELDGLSAGADIAAVMASDLQVQANGNPEQALISYFSASDALIVLDNCEHLLEESAHLVSLLLRNCPGLTVLATSREPLGLSAETVLPVPPLPVNAGDTREPRDAVTLFVDRARTAVPDFVPEGDDLRTIGDICVRLEGLPLAIELAAVRLRVLSPAQILERLDDQLAFLTRGNRDLPERQRALRSSIEWSYELCERRERWLWARLSVFAGSWDLDAAEGIIDPAVLAQEEVVDVLQSLIEKSLVVTHSSDGEVWYAMLNSIREFGLDVLASESELTKARRAHRDWYVRRLREAELDWIGPNQSHWLALFLRELPNLRLALEFSLDVPGEAMAALELTTFAWRICWQAPGRIDEHRRWLARALAANPADSGLRAGALCLDALFAAAQGDPGLAAAEMTEAKAIVDRIDEPIYTTLVYGASAELLPDSPEALALHRRAADLQSSMPDLIARANSAARLALMYDRMGDDEHADELRRSILAVSETTGERYETSYLLVHSAILAAYRGDAKKAKELARRSLRMKRHLSHPFGVAQAQETLAIVAVLEHDFETASQLLGASQDVWRRTGGAPLTLPPLLSNRDDYAEMARAALGDEEFERACEDGRRLSTEESIDLALGEVTPRPTAPQPEPPATSTTILTAREDEVAALVADGLSDKQIGAKLFISQRTAEGHVQRALTKLGFTSRTQLAVWSTKNTTS